MKEEANTALSKWTSCMATHAMTQMVVLPCFCSEHITPDSDPRSMWKAETQTYLGTTVKQAGMLNRLGTQLTPECSSCFWTRCWALAMPSGKTADPGTVDREGSISSYLHLCIVQKEHMSSADSCPLPTQFHWQEEMKTCRVNRFLLSNS